ncbi:cellulase family glycosylhydrolase [Nocardia sp. NPDC051052]|uniref:cellulase family glycosylhydrolase n=1 Tax=Nocardia sp. NPDC051052 TaxID=3364322 RepID=UPI0037B43070
MKPAVRSAVILSAFAIALAATPGAGPAGAQDFTELRKPAAGSVGHAGKWMVDGAGRVVILHGENVAVKRAPYRPSAAGFGDPDADLLAREGFNAARIAVFWAAVEPEPGQYDDGYLADIAGTVAMLNSRGISTVLELHQDLWSAKYGGSGAPDWASIEDGFPTVPGNPATGAITNPAYWQASENFYNNRQGPGGVGIRDRFLAMWRHMAGYFSGVGGVIGYGPLNQPPAGSAFLPCLANACPPVAADRIQALGRDVSSAIRDNDPATPIWLGGLITSSFGASPQLGPPPDPNTVYGFNSYCVVAAFAGGTGVGCGPQWESGAAQAQGYSDATQTPAVVTEFGATGAHDALNENIAIFDNRQVGWFHWTYLGGDPATVSADPDAQAVSVNPSLLDVLARPYPQLTSGTPGPWRFDPGTKQFDYSWSTARATGDGGFPAGAQTLIATPDRQYPGGYHVQVAGGRRVSEPGGQLRIESCPGAGQVSVTVQAGTGPDNQGC